MAQIKIKFDTGLTGDLWNSFIEQIVISRSTVEYNKNWYVNLKEYESFKEDLMYDYKDVSWKIKGGINNSTIISIRDFINDVKIKKLKKKEDKEHIEIEYTGDSDIVVSFNLFDNEDIRMELRDLVYKCLVDEIKTPDFLKNEEDKKFDSFNRQIKSRERVEKRGEVFTNEREVKAMCDLVKQETDRIDSRFLEPACGDGNFLSEILSRKLATVKRKYKKSPFDFEKQSLLAVSSIYGVDIMQDNVIECRKRLFTIWEKQYKTVCKNEYNQDTVESIQFILKRNIVCGNALTLKCVDENANDTDEPIVFSEWAFVTGNNMQRCDYTFAELLSGKKNADSEGIFLHRYVTNYRRLKDYE